jgi:hypothetical protein
LPSNSPHDHMILRVDLVGSHGRWKRPCLQTSPDDDDQVDVTTVEHHAVHTPPAAELILTATLAAPGCWVVVVRARDGAGAVARGSGGRGGAGLQAVGRAGRLVSISRDGVPASGVHYLRVRAR